MTRWVGRWIIAVGVIHCIFGATIFYEPILEIIRDGLWNAVDGYPRRPLAFWFVFLGMLTILFGALVDWVEADSRGFPAFLRYGFLLITILGVVTMPVGGGWLLIPGAIGLFLKKASTPADVGA